MILEAWRHFGYLRWNLLLSDEDRYFENTKWAARVRSRAAAAKTSEPRHGVAFQRRVTATEKSSEGWSALRPGSARASRTAIGALAGRRVNAMRSVPHPSG